MKSSDLLLRFPPSTNGAIVVLSGGMDSTIIARFACEKYGSENVQAISYYYKQKQSIELTKAQETCKQLNIKHQIIDISFLGDVARGISSNIQDSVISMPTIHDILGDPQPTTYIPNRNMILLSIAVAAAEAQGKDVVLTGLQANDQYSYHDTTAEFVHAINSVISQNRKNKINIVAPIIDLNKSKEIAALLDLDKSVDLLYNTITCYNPQDGKSCGNCPSCAERIHAFMNNEIVDPIEYLINIPWR